MKVGPARRVGTQRACRRASGLSCDAQAAQPTEQKAARSGMQACNSACNLDPADSRPIAGGTAAPPHRMFGPTVPLSPPASRAQTMVSGTIEATSALTRKNMGRVPATVQPPAGVPSRAVQPRWRGAWERGNALALPHMRQRQRSGEGGPIGRAARCNACGERRRARRRSSYVQGAPMNTLMDHLRRLYSHWPTMPPPTTPTAPPTPRKSSTCPATGRGAGRVGAGCGRHCKPQRQRDNGWAGRGWTGMEGRRARQSAGLDTTFQDSWVWGARPLKLPA